MAAMVALLAGLTPIKPSDLHGNAVALKNMLDDAYDASLDYMLIGGISRTWSIILGRGRLWSGGLRDPSGASRGAYEVRRLKLLLLA